MLNHCIGEESEGSDQCLPDLEADAKFEVVKDIAEFNRDVSNAKRKIHLRCLEKVLEEESPYTLTGITGIS